MSQGTSHVFSEIFLHLNWHCKNNKPMIQSAREPPLYSTIEEYCRKTKGIHFKALGGTEDHVHLVFQMEPFVALSEFIGRVKGASSHEMNKHFGPHTIQWQRGYGIVSFSGKYLSGIIHYVEGQKEHHRAGTTNPTLEAFGDDTEGPDD